jgi:uncharacterized integral membrane protein (TIGR00698 family)
VPAPDSAGRERATTGGGPARALTWLAIRLPGLALTAAIAAAALLLHRLPLFALLSPLILSVAVGTAVNALGWTPAQARAGLAFTVRRVLRLGVILLGLQLTLAQIASIGTAGFLVIALSLGATFLATRWMGRVLGVSAELSELIAAGTSICGASAVIAVNTVTRARDEDVTYAVAMVTVFGSLAMFAWPVVGTALHLAPAAYGLWTGASVHEIAQVVAAAFQHGPEAGEYGTIAKLTRVLMLAPLVMALGLAARRQTAGDGGAIGSRPRPPFPWFVMGFVGLMLLNSAAPLAAPARAGVVAFTSFILSMALAAMGLQTDVRKLVTNGVRPLLLAAFASAFIAALSFMLVRLFFHRS